MTTVNYKLVEEPTPSNHAGTSPQTTYGIAAYSASEKDAARIVIRDITTDKQKLETFIRICNQLDLSLIHFNEVIEDFLVEGII